MKHASKIFSALSGALLCLVCGLAGAQQAQQPAASAPQARPAAKNLLVGVVDLRAVLQTHPVIVDQIPALSAKLQEEQVALGKAKEDADQKVAKLQKEYNLVIGTPEFEDKVGSVRKEFSDAEFKAREVQQKLVAERTQLLFRAYEDLQKSIEVVAKQNGIIIVHSKIKIAVPENAAVSKEVVALEEADQNTIVWNRPECDITEQVKAQLAVVAGAPKGKAETGGSLNNLGAQAINARAEAGNAPAPARQPAATAARSANAPAASQRR
ncbi:MAG: OmpH family outer membrane protein [Thermoguttaceae bacterium]|nr:OmpH family outer membrane protein [Thermoguttaceae bacterium]